MEKVLTRGAVRGTTGCLARLQTLESERERLYVTEACSACSAEKTTRFWAEDQI